MSQQTFTDWLKDFSEMVSTFADGVADKLEELPGRPEEMLSRSYTELHTYNIEVPAGTVMPPESELERLVEAHFGVKVTITS